MPMNPVTGFCALLVVMALVALLAGGGPIGTVMAVALLLWAFGAYALSRNRPDPQVQEIAQRQLRIVARVAGSVLLLMGLAIAAALAFFAALAFGEGWSPATRRDWLWVVGVLVAVFAFVVGMRLALLLPNAEGSILSRAMWIVLAFIFFNVTMLAGYHGVTSGDSTATIAGAFGALMVAACVYLATRSR